MKIYRIECLNDDFQSLDYDYQGDEEPRTQEEMIAHIEKAGTLRRCQPVTQLLTPPQVFSKRPKLARPDFWQFNDYLALALPAASAEKVRHFLEASGELLPLPYKSEIFSVLNVLKCINYRVFSENVPGHLHQESMEGKIPDSIFRDTDRVYLYVAEKTGDPATEFKAFVEHEKMTGLEFREIWNSAR